jgi:hypothetical protein
MKRFYSITAIAIVFLLPAISANAKHILADINNLHVTIIHTGEEPNGLAWEKIKDEVNGRLKQAGIEVFVPEPGVMYKLPIWPELKICVDMLTLEQSQQYVFHIQTLLAKNVYVAVKPAIQQKADVWKTEPVMQAVSAQEMSANLNKVVLEQAEVFIRAWQAANPKGIHPIDANQARSELVEPIGTSQKESAQPPATIAATKYLYVSSKNSKVFHKSTCTWAKKIKPENLISYSSRDEAINAGKKPCKSCNP